MADRAKHIENVLAEVFRNKLPGFQKIKTMTKLTQGANSLMYKVVAAFRQNDVSEGKAAMTTSAPSFTRCYCARFEDISSNTPTTVSLSIEAELMNLARRHDLPVPEVVLRPADFSASTDHDDTSMKGVITEWLEGETLGSRIVKLAKSKKVEGELLAQQCGEILAKLHSVRYEEALSTEALSKMPVVTARDTVNELYSSFCALKLIRPGVEFVFNWLWSQLGGVERAAKDSKLCLVHGDFRNGNLMIRPGSGIVGVLDWEMAHIGDPYSDLAYLCLESWRFNHHEKEVGGFGDRASLLEAYVAHVSVLQTKSITIDMKLFTFWKVACSLKWCLICLTMGMDWVQQNAQSDQQVSVERAVIARRASEAELDALKNIHLFELAYAPGSMRLGSSFPGAAGNRCFEVASVERKPAAETEDLDGTSFVPIGELLRAASVFLKSQSKEPSVAARLRYLSLVLRNGVLIAARELDLGEHIRSLEFERQIAVFRSSPALAACLPHQKQQYSKAAVEHLRRILVDYLKQHREVQRTSSTTSLVLKDREVICCLGYHFLLSIIGQVMIDQPKYAGLQSAKKVAVIINSHLFKDTERSSMHAPVDSNL